MHVMRFPIIGVKFNSCVSLLLWKVNNLPLNICDLFECIRFSYKNWFTKRANGGFGLELVTTKNKQNTSLWIKTKVLGLLIALGWLQVGSNNFVHMWSAKFSQRLNIKINSYPQNGIDYKSMLAGGKLFNLRKG